MIRTTLMVTVVVCLACSFHPANAQLYRAPDGTNLTGSGINPSGEAVGSGVSTPPESSYNEGYVPLPSGGGLTNNEATGGGVTEGPYSSYNPGNASGLSGGGLDDETQVPAASPRAKLAPNGETYRSLGISGY